MKRSSLFGAAFAAVLPIVGLSDVPGLAVFHLHLVEMAKQRQVPLETVAREAQSWGVSGVDLWFENGEAEGARLLAAGMKPASVVVFMDLAHTNDVRRTERAVAYARRCGSPRIMLVPGFLRKDEDRDAAWPTVKGNLREFLVRAEKAGLTVDVEDFDSQWIVFGSRAHLRRAFAEFPSLGHVLDTGNYDSWKDDVLAAQEEFAGRIRHVHIKDRGKDRPTVSVAAGTGTVPVREIVRRLVTSGYANWMTMECFGSTNMTADIKASADYLRPLLAR